MHFIEAAQWHQEREREARAYPTAQGPREPESTRSRAGADDAEDFDEADDADDDELDLGSIATSYALDVVLGIPPDGEGLSQGTYLDAL